MNGLQDNIGLVASQSVLARSEGTAVDIGISWKQCADGLLAQNPGF